jgi:hypothetical protein
MKQTKNGDSLHSLFKELPKEQTSEQFMSSIMEKVCKEQKVQERTNFWMSILLPLAGISAAILATALLLYFFVGFSIENQLETLIPSLSSVFSSFPSPKSYLNELIYGLAVLLLLLFDLLYRHSIQKKKES